MEEIAYSYEGISRLPQKPPGYFDSANPST
jgi:hypothetical protein